MDWKEAWFKCVLGSLILALVTTLAAQAPKGMSPLPSDEMLEILKKSQHAEEVYGNFQRLQEDMKYRIEQLKLAHGAAGCSLSRNLAWVECAKFSAPQKKEAVKK